MKKLSLLLPILLILISISACDSDKKRKATGIEDKIYVIADSTDYEKIYPQLDSVFGKLIYTPQPEKSFELLRRDYALLEDLKSLKNIIILAPLNSEGIVAKYVNAILDSTVREKVRTDSEFVFNKYNLWADGQLVMILTAPTMEVLKNRLSQNKEELLYYFQKVSNKRLSQNLYNEKFENEELEAEFLKKYGWLIYIQDDLQLAVEAPEDNFVWLRRSPGSEMERWIFVHWIENASPEFLNTDSIYNERNRLTEKYYRTSDDKFNVVIAEDYKTSTEVNFNGKYAIATQGLWEMNDKSMGGPFINYTFYDENTRRIYMLDGSIYAPKFFKKSLIQQVDVILQSFMTEQEVSKEKKKDLLDSYKEKK